MEENTSVSLLTPASDLVGGSTTAEIEAIFGRAGNDVLFPFDPTATYPDINIDILFGDLFDNSADEFEIVLGITEGRPLGILNTNIPSVGRDRFVLGDESTPFYTAPNPFDANNILGTNEFAVIYDFDPTQDVIQLFGKEEDYSLIEINDLEVEGIEQAFSGEAIIYNGGITPDLIGYIISTPEQDFDFKDDKDAFDFVGDKGKDKGKKDIVRLGTPGFDQAQATTIDSAGNIYVVGSTSGSIGGINQGRGDVYIAKYNNNGNQVWLRQLGSSESESAFEVVTDENGDVYVAGDTSGSLVGAKQSADTDAWVAKFSGGNGDIIWGQQFNAGVEAGDTANPSFTSTAFGLDVRGSQVYVSGLAIKNNQNREIFDFSVQDDSWLGVFDKNTGAKNRFTQVRDPQAPFPLNITPFFDENYDLAVDDAGNAYLVGWTQGLSKEADPSRLLLKYDAYLAKIDPSGNVDWVQQFGTVGEGLEFGWAVDTDSQGNVFASGWTTGDFVGDSTSPDADSYDVFISKFDASGNQLVSKELGTDTDDGQYFSDLLIDDDDNVYLTGYTNNKKFGDGGKTKGEDTDAFVAKLDANLDEQWITQIGVKEKLDYATGVATDGNGSVIVSGFTSGAIGNGPGENIDGWVARLDDEKGKLEKFIGKDEDGGNVFVTAGNISVTDITDSVVTNEALPDGDNDISTGLGFADLGGIDDGLSQAFNPSNAGSFSDAIVSRFQGDPGSGDLDSSSLLMGTDEKDKMKGEDTSDTMFGMGGDDKLEGKDGNDVLYGGLGSDEIKGGDGNDRIVGIDINDSLLGGGDIDKLKGEKGADTFVLGNASGVFYRGEGYGKIEDFEAKEGDRIQLSGSADDYTLGGKKGNDIFYQGDLIAEVKDAKDLDLFDTSVFDFV
ncbi:MAG: SBBP repeat-containing protein [Cyanobacteria bacterium J06560_6]